jgi:kinesin family protein 6/9
VQVFIRTRPTDEFASKNLAINTASGDFDVRIDKEDEGHVNNKLDNWKFKFDHILQNATQDDVYDLTAAQIATNVVAGYNGTIMCYGQTGAGKTFSMLGLTNNFK